MRAAFGSGAASDYTDASLDKLKNTFKMAESHYVSPDLTTHNDILAQLKKHGIKPVYDGEMAVWVNTGMNVSVDISNYGPQLQALKDIGWSAFSSEGLSEKQVSVITQYLPYINYGGEMGENVYASNSMYYRPLTMAYGNYLECYHKGVDYDPAFLSANRSTPNNMGMTFMLYTTATLEMDPPALIDYIDKLIKSGIKINTMLFWVGVNQAILPKLENDFNFLWKALNDYYHFTIEDDMTPDEIILGSNPGVTTLDNIEYHFVTGTNNQLYWKIRMPDGTLSDWASLGGVLTSGPTASTRADGTIVVAARGYDKDSSGKTIPAEWRISMKDSVWSKWEKLGGILF